MADLLNKVDWKWLSSGEPVRFHGDFHFDNILVNTDRNSFIFLDWRQEFGGSLEVGDLYYDLGKLMHGLIVSHDLIHRNEFKVEWGEDEINFELMRKQSLVECEKFFEAWLEKEGLDKKKVRVMAALIYLNIAALHHYPYSLLLFALGKRMLAQELFK